MAEEIVDALVLAARYDIQGLKASERALIDSLDNVSRAVLKASAATQGPFSDLSRDIIKANAAFQQGVLPLEGYNVALQQARLELKALREAGYEPNAKQLAILNRLIEASAVALASQGKAASAARGVLGGTGAQLGLVARGSDSMASGLARARSGLAQLAVTGLGTTAALGQVAQGILFIGGASTVGIIGAALTVAVLGKAYELLTKKTREATEARDKLNTALKERIQGSFGDSAQLQREIAASEEARAIASKKVNDALKGELSALTIIKLLLIDRKKLNEDTLKTAEGIALLQRTNANEQLAAQRDIILGAERIRDANIAAAEAAAKARQAVASERETPTFGAQPGFISQQEQRAAQENIRLTKEATDQAIHGLQIRLDFAKSVQAATDDEVRKKKVQIALLEQDIQLRQQAGDSSVAQLKAELDLTAATRERVKLEQDHARRVQGLGGGNILGAAPTVQPELFSSTRQADVDKAGLPSAAAIEAFGRDVAVELRNASDAALEKATISLPTKAQLAALAGDIRGSLKVGLPEGKEIETLGRLVADRLKIPMPTPAEIQRLGQEFAQEFNISAALPSVQSLRDIASGFNLQLPTPEDVNHLREALAKIPPVGLPTKDQVVAAWSAAFDQVRRDNIAPILQGARQQGLVSGSGDAIQADNVAAKSLADEMRDVRRQILGATASALQLGHAFASALDSVAGIGSALADLKQAKLDLTNAESGEKGDAARLSAQVAQLSAIGGAIGAGIGLLGSIGSGLFGKSDTQVEHDNIRAQNANTLATERNTAAVERAQSAGGLADVQEKLRAALSGPDAARARAFAENPVVGGKDAAATFDRLLKEAGLSLEELAQIAKANNIDILDEKGRLVAGGLDALSEALALAEARALELDDSIAARRSRAETEDKLGISARSDDDKVAALQRERDVQLDALELDPETEAKIRALDLATIEGRKAFLEFQRDLFRRATTEGGITAEQLGKFANVDELTASVDAAADALKAIEEAANDASKGLTNIPDTFKLVTAEWEARAKDAISPIGIRPGPAPISEPVGSFLPSQRGNDGSQLPKTEITGNTIQLLISVSGTGKSAGDIARQIADELEERGLGTSGLAPAP